MAHPEDRLSTTPVVSNWLDPDGRTYGLNEDWEAGPVAVQDTSQGLNNQAWHLTFAGGTFTITPETTGLPVDVLTGQDSIQCTFAFDQNGRPSIAWQDSQNRGFLYWYDSAQADFVITQFAITIVGVGMTLDDKRARQTGASDILIYYTVPFAIDQYSLYMRRQRDRYQQAIVQKEPSWPYIHKSGMNDGLRVQLGLSTESP